MKKLYSLKQNYISVKDAQKDPEHPSYSFGGSQLYFRNGNRPLDKYRASSGCGIVALNDVLAYLKGRNEYKDIDSYKKAFNKASKLTFWIPVKFGLSFIQQALGLFIQLKIYRMPYRNHWCFSKKKMFDRVRIMLKNDIPVILCIPRVHGKKASTDLLPMYNEKAVRTNGTNGHFVVVTGICQDETSSKLYFEISSWGCRYYIEYSEYLHFLKHHFNGLLGNIMYIRKTS